MNLRYTPREAAAPVLTSPIEPETSQQPHLRRASREAVAEMGSGREEEAARRSALATHLAFRGAIGDVSGSTRRISSQLSRLQTSHWGIAGKAAGIFAPYVEYGIQQLRWIDAELAAATRLANAASEVDDPDMQLALLRLVGPRLEAAMLGSILLSGWLDHLNLADGVLAQCHFYSKEALWMDMGRLRKMIEPSMKALSSLEPGQVEAAAQDIPALMGQLSSEFHSTTEAVRVAQERGEKFMMVAQVVEMVTMVSTLKMSLPRMPPSAPATLGLALVVGGDGVMMGTRIVVSAEWVEMMRQLVRAGVISLPAVSAAVRIHAGQVMVAQAHDELPKGVREALGDGPEVRGMRVTGRAGAGMAEPPRHHVMPKEFREWFEKHGFTGEMSIDQFCVEMEQASHEAIHGGGDWRLGRTWPGEWNRMIMDALYQAETRAGRMLTRNEVLDIVAYRMRRYSIPMEFTRWRGQ